MRAAAAGCWLLVGLCSAGLSLAQETQLGADFRREGEHFKESCEKFSFGAIAGCGQVLFTDHPLHVAVGSIAPQNGVGFGPAFVSHWTPNEAWRFNYSVDGVVSTNGSWRAGAYFLAVPTRRRGPTVVTGGTAPSKSARELPFPIIHGYVQATSLNKIGFFGIGPNTSDTARSWFGMRETVAGTNVIWPIATRLNLSLWAEANGRFVDIRPSLGNSSPSTDQLYNDAQAPGLRSQTAFAQFGQGIRLRPSLAHDFVRLNYFATFKEYIAGDSTFSFQRFTLDAQHQIPLYHRTRTYLPRDGNTPDSCATNNQDQCPKITRDREGAFNVELYMNTSYTATGHAVPFYFQPTLGGADINGVPWLASYQDYRFRAPNLLVARASFEHSLYGPLGFTLGIDEGKVALMPGDLGFSHLRHSYTAGLTLRAGGLPFVYLLFAWGGNEGTHTIANLNTSLLGGSARPGLQ